MLDEPEILDGMRAWNEAQAALNGTVAPERKRYDVDVGWYGTSVDEHEGAFCLIRSESNLEELVGDVVRIGYGTKEIFVYCIGGTADIDTDLAVARAAFMRLDVLSKDDVFCTAQAVTRA